MAISPRQLWHEEESRTVVQAMGIERAILKVMRNERAPYKPGGVIEVPVESQWTPEAIVVVARWFQDEKWQVEWVDDKLRFFELIHQITPPEAPLEAAEISDAQFDALLERLMVRDAELLQRLAARAMDGAKAEEAKPKPDKAAKATAA